MSRLVVSRLRITRPDMTRPDMTRPDITRFDPLTLLRQAPAGRGPGGPAGLASMAPRIHHRRPQELAIHAGPRPARNRRYSMTLRIGDTAPDFEADTTAGRIRFHEWVGDSFAVLFSHPKDFTPVCTTELGYMAKLEPEFKKRNVKIIGLSIDPVDSHAKWSEDIKETQGFAPNYPMIGDPELKVAKAWGMLPAETAGTSQGRTAADNYTVRNIFVVGPDKKIKLILVYPMTTGRNFDEVLRVVDSL
jgi:thioredoxin-dependent peroxiredoxin